MINMLTINVSEYFKFDYLSLSASTLLSSPENITTSRFTDTKLSSFFPHVRSLNANTLKTFKAKLGEEYFKNRTTIFSTLCRR